MDTTNINASVLELLNSVIISGTPGAIIKDARGLQTSEYGVCNTYAATYVKKVGKERIPIIPYCFPLTDL